MRISELTKRIKVEKNTPTEAGADEYHQTTAVWASYLSAMARIDSGPSREFWAARQLHAEATHVITIHWRRDLDVTKEVRFKWTDRGDYAHVAYPLGPPTNLGGNRNRWLEFICREQMEAT